MLAKKPIHVEVEYDQTLGYPRRVFIDPTNLSDDEHGFVICSRREEACEPPRLKRGC